MTTSTGRKWFNTHVSTADAKEEEDRDLVPASWKCLFYSWHFSPASLSPIVLQLSEFPRIANEKERNDYKREFDRDHQEYKDLQAELDSINKNLADVDRELDELQEGSPQYLVRA